MAAAALDVYKNAGTELRADLDLVDVMQDLREVRTADESRELTEGGHGPSIIISSSGMATGGRVLHHLERMLPDPRNVVVLTGYQAVGTRGRALLDGATRLKMRGRYVGVKAEIVRDEEFSVHADGSELLDWIRDLDPAPGVVYCTHGEPEAAAALAASITAQTGIDAVVPSHGEVVRVEPADRYAPRTAPVQVAESAGQEAAEPSVPAAMAAVPEQAPVGVSVDGISFSGAEIDADLTPREDTDGSIVLEGTISIRLRPTAPT